jgi:hypothetical protein
MQYLLKALQSNFGIENKGHVINHGNHDLEWMDDKCGRCYGRAS